MSPTTIRENSETTLTGEPSCGIPAVREQNSSNYEWTYIIARTLT